MYRYMWKTRQKIETVAEKLRANIYKKVGELQIEAWMTKEPVPFNEKDKTGTYAKMKKGDKWGDLFDCAWFHFTGAVPEEMKGEKIVLLIDINGEGCIYDDNGVAQRGITNVLAAFQPVFGRAGKRVVQFAECAKGGEKIDFWVDGGCNDLGNTLTGDGRIKDADIATCNDPMRDLYYDYHVLYDLMMALPEESARQKSIFCTLMDAAHLMMDFTDEEVAAAQKMIRPEISKKGGDPSLTVIAVGHAHLDLTWLWPMRETKRKVERTFSTALNMLERYDHYIFGASQAQLYQWIKDQQPVLFEKIKEKVKSGRWEIQGGCWTEFDTNMPSGESLVRQIMHGKNFYKKEFGYDVRTMWLPDTFGFSAALPQLMKKAGMDYFLTMKTAANLINQMPYNTFYWQGIDGTKTLTHILPEGNYVSAAKPASVIENEKKFKDKGKSDYTLTCFGVGDGGGGPGPEHLERLKRIRNLAGISPVRPGKAIDFFELISEKTERLETWVGEMYMDRHQGCFTSQAKAKLYNRLMENALRELEFAQNFAKVRIGADFTETTAEVDSIWKDVLLYQFHDILPGSSYKRVYDEAYARYLEMLERVGALTETAYERVTDSIDTGKTDDARIVFNSLSWDRVAWVKIGSGWVKSTIPAMGYSVVDAGSASAAKMPDGSFSDSFIENDCVKVTFNDDGTIGSIFDKKAGRETVSDSGSANRLVIFRDEGDAWDFDISYHSMPEELLRLTGRAASAEGPEVVMHSAYSYGKSTFTQDVRIMSGSPVVEFDTKVDWQENAKMLKTIFDVDVFAENVTCDIQFGSIKRPTHDSTSFDFAKYEICAQKWVDLSSRDYGVAMLNDCKYGHKVKDGVMEMTLLRSTQYPGENADIGEQIFKYAIYPHQGDECAAGVAKKGYEFNVPMVMMKPDAKNKDLPPSSSLIMIENENIIVEAIKKAEDGNGLVIRMYERFGANAAARVKLDFNFKTAYLTDLMEKNIHQLDTKDNVLCIPFKPFEIITVMIDFN